MNVPRHFEVAAYCKKTANYFLYFTDDTYKSVLFTTACSFLFYQSNRLDKGGVRGCAKRRAAIDSAQDWTDQAKVLSSESFLLCIPLDALLTAVYICLLTTKKRRKNSPYHSSSSLHSPNKQHVRPKSRCFCDRRLMPFISYYDKKERPCLQAYSYKKFCIPPLPDPERRVQARDGELPLLWEPGLLHPFRQL